MSEENFLYSFQNRIIVWGINGDLTSVDSGTGKIIWDVNIAHKFSSVPYVLENKIVIGEADNYLTVISMESGKVISRNKTITSPSVILSDNKSIFWGDERGQVFAVNSSNYKTIWKIRNGAAIKDLKITNSGLLISSLDNFIYLISFDEGDRIWKKRLTGRILATPFITESYVVVTVVGDTSASILDLRTGKKVNQISVPDKNYFTDSPILTNDNLLFSTIRGIFSFSFTDESCMDK
jgi:outer membrane protein assembly factor BamB